MSGYQIGLGILLRERIRVPLRSAQDLLKLQSNQIQVKLCN